MLFFCNSLFRVGLEWIRTRIFFSHIPSLSHPFLAWKEAMLMFFNFFNSFAIFLEFPIPGRFGMDQNENFFFLTFSASLVSFWLEKKPYWCFLIFWIFLLFFCDSLFRVGLEWIRTRIFFFSHSQPIPSLFGLKRSHIDVF